VSDLDTFGPDRTDPTGPPRVAWLWLGAFAAGSALYLATCQRSVSWQDSGMFQQRVLDGDFTGRLGLALAHPLYIAAGRLLAAAAPAHLPLLLNAFSGVGMAVALANLAAAGAVLTGRRWVGAAAAAMLAVTHTSWWLATVAEVYTWSAAGLAGELWLVALLLRRPSTARLAGLALVSGLGLSVHNFALLPLPVYAGLGVWLVATRRLPARALAAAFIAWVAGAGLYLGMVARLAVSTGDLAAAVHSALFGHYAPQVLSVGARWTHMKTNLALMALNFANLLGPLAAVGWLSFARRLGRPAAVVFGLITLIEAAFVLRYPVPDQFTFFVPTMVLVALAAAVGLHTLAPRKLGTHPIFRATGGPSGTGEPARKLGCVPSFPSFLAAAVAVSVAAPPCLYAFLPGLVHRASLMPRRTRTLPFRDEARYWLVPWKQNQDSARRFARAALRLAAPDGVIRADGTSQPPLTVTQRLEHLAPNVLVQCDDGALPPYEADPAAFRRALAGRKLFVVSPVPQYTPPRLLEDARFLPVGGGVLYEAEWKAPAK